MNIVNKHNFIDMLPIITKKIQEGYKMKIEFIKNEDQGEWKTVVDFQDGVDAKEVLDFLEEDGRKVEETIS
jgi:hypothetical protein